MNLPNKLTMMRVVLVPVFMIFAAVSHYGTADFHAAYMLIAGVIFAIASITDFLDGYLARKNHLVTDFGKFMDPLADKCLTTAAFIYMGTDHVCSPVVLAVILFREFAVAGVRMLAAETGTVIAANMWGKVKTVLQMLTIIFYYFVGALAGPTDVGFVSFVTIVLCWLCGAATLLSGGIYLWQPPSRPTPPHNPPRPARARPPPPRGLAIHAIIHQVPGRTCPAPTRQRTQ